MLSTTTALTNIHIQIIPIALIFAEQNNFN